MKTDDFIGACCSSCKFVWLIVALPNDMKYVASQVLKHKFCPACKAHNPMIAKSQQLKDLMPIS